MHKITKHITVEEMQIAVEIRDRESKVAWVFLHGWEGNKEVWNGVTQNFPATTVGVDLPGFGRSSDLQKPLSTADYSKIVMKLIEEIELDNVVLVGHSFGGQIAVHVGSDQPSWLHGLVLVGASAVRSSEAKMLSSIGSFLSPVFKLPVLRKLRPAIYKLIGADIPPEDENLKRTMQIILKEDQSKNLSQITVPTKVVWGDKDEAVAVDDGKFIAEKIPNADLVVLSGGHHIFLDAPQAFRQRLIDFHNTMQS